MTLFKEGRQQTKQDAFTANLLISLLTRFSEIMSINFDMPNDRCRFTFMLLGKIGHNKIAYFKERLEESLATYYELTGEYLSVTTKINRSRKFSFLQVNCCTSQLSLDAIQLITAIVDTVFNEEVLKELETTGIVEDEEMFRQEEIIEYLLNHTTTTKNDNLIAFREAGKVYVFDK